jgi:hypothetical protein
VSGSGIGEAIHFLERLNRANEAQREMALALYWDPDKVRRALAMAALPEGEGRVALSINEQDHGPFIVVTREGRFVTCLAEGMKHDLPQIGHARLSALLAKVETHRERVQMAQELCGDKRLDSIFGIIWRKGEGTCREEFLAACALQPVLRGEILADAMHQFNQIADLHEYLRRCKVIKRGDEAILRQYWQRLWYMGVMYPLFAMGGSRGLDPLFETMASQELSVSMSWPLLRHDDRMLILRGLFSVARIGKPLLSGVKQRYRAAGSPLIFCDAFLSLVTLAVRLPKHRKEIARVLGRYQDMDPHVLHYLKKFPEGFYKIVAMVIDNPDRVYDLFGEALPEIAFDSLTQLGVLPQTHFERAEDIPIDQAYTIMANFSDPTFVNPKSLEFVMMFIPWLVRIEGPELFLPRELMMSMPCKYDKKRALEMLDRRKKFYESVREGLPPRPKAPPRPGRNDPCSCGSGKKYKNCCRGKEADPEEADSE